MRSLLLAALLAAPLAAAQQAPVPTPPEGVPLKVRRGFFAETDLGVFWTLGGENRYSNAQSYLQLGVGVDLTERLTVGAHFGLGSSAVNCFAGYLPDSDVCRLPDNFTVAFANGSLAYNFTLGERFYLSPKLLGGMARLDPAPIGEDGRTAAILAPNAGLGVGIEYFTSMDHFSVGADFAARAVLVPGDHGGVIPTFALFPRVKYTF